MKIHCKYTKLVPLDDLLPNPKNRNKHPQEQIDQLAKIFKYQGIRHPIIVSNQTGLIVAGHGRLEAARKAGLAEFPVDYQDFDTPEKEYAFAVSDNAISLWADLDLSGINSDLGDLGPDFDIGFLGIEDFGLDPPGISVEKEPDSGAADGVQVMRLYFNAEDYSDLLPRAQELTQSLGLNDMSQLFRHLVIEKHLGAEHNEITDA